MLPRKLAHDTPQAERRRWRIIRLDTHKEMAGEILSADVDAGVCTMKGSDGEVRDYSFGPGGFAIIGK